MIAIACDHAGIDLKPHVIAVLEELGIPYTDFGTHTRESVDYPLYGARAARAVASGQCERGIVMCGTGVGIGMAAGKVHGIRCVTCTDTYSAKMSRLHNDANMLALGARVLGSELAKDIVRIWLMTAFEGERHARRVGMIDRLDRGEALE
ncbi:MAG TPA: ribose 5-phosphate isomerase B [Candidatus Limiplasma stercoravium]|nr:ribose 5-phosphate isomerase B [Candidatus Limiplasma stercoravium]